MKGKSWCTKCSWLLSLLKVVKPMIFFDFSHFFTMFTCCRSFMDRFFRKVPQLVLENLVKSFWQVSHHLYTGCLNMLCPTSNQHFFRLKWHSKQKALIFGILSRGDLCLIHDFFIIILYSASTASDLQGVKIQVIWSHAASNLRLWD